MPGFDSNPPSRMSCSGPLHPYPKTKISSACTQPHAEAIFHTVTYPSQFFFQNALIQTIPVKYLPSSTLNPHIYFHFVASSEFPAQIRINSQPHFAYHYCILVSRGARILQAAKMRDCTPTSQRLCKPDFIDSIKSVTRLKQ